MQTETREESRRRQSREAQRRYRARLTDAQKEQNRAYHKEYCLQYREQFNARRRERHRTDPQFIAAARLRATFRQALRLHGDGRKTTSVTRLLGCTVEQFCAYVTTRFTEGMSWENQGDWHLDHILPCASFDLTDPVQQRLCFHYTNLRPLWKRDNQSKSGRTDTLKPQDVEKIWT